MIVTLLVYLMTFILTLSKKQFGKKSNNQDIFLDKGTLKLWSLMQVKYICSVE